MAPSILQRRVPHSPHNDHCDSPFISEESRPGLDGVGTPINTIDPSEPPATLDDPLGLLATAIIGSEVSNGAVKEPPSVPKRDFKACSIDAASHRVSSFDGAADRKPHATEDACSVENLAALVEAPDEGLTHGKKVDDASSAAHVIAHRVRRIDARLDETSARSGSSAIAGDHEMTASNPSNLKLDRALDQAELSFPDASASVTAPASKRNTAPKDDLSAFISAVGYQVENDSPFVEYAPLFTHECLENDAKRNMDDKKDNEDESSAPALEGIHVPSSLTKEIAIDDSDSYVPCASQPGVQMSGVLFDGNRVSPRRSGSDHSPILESIREEGSNPHPVRTMGKRDSITGTSPTRIRERIHDDSTFADASAQGIGSGYFGNDGPSVPLGVVRIEMSWTSHGATIVIDPAAQSSVSGETRCRLDSSTALKAAPKEGIPFSDERKAMQKMTVKYHADDAPA